MWKSTGSIRDSCRQINLLRLRRRRRRFHFSPQLFESEYKSALDRVVQNKIQSVAFSLLSGGIFRASQPLEIILAHGVTAIQQSGLRLTPNKLEKGDALLSQIVPATCTDSGVLGNG
jgi:hypothetical protein